MRAAQLDSKNIVINFAEVTGFDTEFVDPLDAVIGSMKVGNAFVLPPAPPPVVPQSVSRFQALAALSKAGLLTTAQEIANGSPDPLVGLAFNNAQTFDRDSPTVAALAGALGLTSSQLDNLFITAATFQA